MYRIARALTLLTDFLSENDSQFSTPLHILVTHVLGYTYSVAFGDHYEDYISIIIHLSARIIKRRWVVSGYMFSAVDEAPDCGETPIQTAELRAEAKAHAVAAVPKYFVIGADQVCYLDGVMMGKPQSEMNGSIVYKL